ncbi:pyridoxal 5'-phosphate synthase glutaminase subunit PdxT [Candidatus Micrarchaeota archaeon]|nr:pyridoxal 5'-phosphate synthase glutaminase subunit PdxT [Candidatus Micrarchaeota archaeon]
MKVGVVGVQGAVSEHLEMLAKANAEGVWVRKKEQLNSIDGLVIPGGESTAISKLMSESNLFEKVKEMGTSGTPVFGTCAGLIMLAKKGDAQVEKTGTRLLELMDVEVNRNAFGRQRESFEAELEVDGVGKFPCVFIRAPAITKAFGECKQLATYNKYIVAAQERNLLATAFHPELTQDTRMHKLFLGMCKR